MKTNFKKNVAILLSVLLALMLFALLLSFNSKSGKVFALGEEVRNVSFKTDGNAEELKYFQSMSGGLFYATGLGYGETDTNSRLIGEAGEIIYFFDFEDDISTAKLNLMSKFLNAKYSLDGISYFDLTLDYTPNYSDSYEVIFQYTLTELDALSNENNQFFVKIFNTSATDGFIHALSITSDSTIDSKVNLNAATALGFVESTSSIIIYFLSGNPVFYSMSDSSLVILKFEVDSQIVTGITPSVTAVGGSVSNYSFNNSDWIILETGALIPTISNDSIYFKLAFISGDKYIQTFGATLEMDFTGMGEDSIFFYADGSESESPYFVSMSGGLLYAIGFGWAGGANSRLCGPDDSIVYFFDLKDEISFAKLNYTARFFTAKYSLDGIDYFNLNEANPVGLKDTYETIHSYDLTESDALSGVNGWNRFYIKLTNTGSADAYLHSLSISSETEIISDQLTIKTADEGLAYYVDGISMVYFSGETDRSSLSFYGIASNYAVYKFNIDNSNGYADVNIAALTNVTISYSFDLSVWTNYDGSISLVGKDAVTELYVKATLTAEAIVPTLQIDVDNRLMPEILVAPTYTGSLTYGDSLPSISGTASVTGTFALVAGQTLTAGTKDYNYIFTPTDTENYMNYNGTMSITVAKATPIITTEPTYTGTLKFGDSLPTISGTASVAGTFALVAGQTLTIGTNNYNYIFTPTDTANYNNYNGTMSITVVKATPIITVEPSFTGSLKVGDDLPEINGTASVAGTFVLDAGQTLTAGTKSYTYTFTPNDSTNYTMVTGTIELTVTEKQTSSCKGSINDFFLLFVLLIPFIILIKRKGLKS